MDIQRFKERLRAKERELVSEITRLGGEAVISSGTDVGDFADSAISSEAASRILDDDAVAWQTLTLVRAALDRIEAGAYGKCIACGRTIERDRLGAIPWTPFCVADQEKQDLAAHVPQGGATL